MKNFFSKSAYQIVNDIKNGKISSVEVCKNYISRIETFEKDIKAWAYFDKEYLLDRAQESDDYRIAGKPLGLLHGLPIAIKDIFGTDDMPTECGTEIKKGSRTKQSEVVNLLKNAGAIIMGKTVTTEFAYFSPSKTRNPHDYNRTPGGSSSGSAAAVASFMAPVSIGSQTNGSVIRPASYCGVYGYKPSYGLISRQGVLKQSNILDQVGIFARSIKDIALISTVLIKKDLHDTSTIYYSSNDMIENASSVLQFDPEFVFYKTPRWENIDKESKKVFEKFINKNEKHIKVFDMPSYLNDIYHYHKIIHETDMAYHFEGYYKKFKKKLSKELTEAIERGLKYSSKDYTEALENREYFYNQFEELFHDYYGILSPCSQGVAPKDLSNTGSPEFCTIWTYFGMPSISLPIMTGSNNLPLGLQLVGQKLDDSRLMKIANWIIKKTNVK